MTDIPSNERTLADATRSSAFWKAETIAANTHIRDLRKSLEHVLDVVSMHEKVNCPACVEARRLLTDEYSVPETQAEPVAWMAEDGRVCTADLKRSQKPIMTAGFTIPLYTRPAPETTEPLQGMWGTGLRPNLPKCDLVLHFNSVEEAQQARMRIYNAFGMITAEKGAVKSTTEPHHGSVMKEAQ